MSDEDKAACQVASHNLSLEMSKGSGQSADLITMHWENTFPLRTEAICRKVRPIIILKCHELLLIPKYLKIEGEILIGKENYLNFENNVLKFISSVQHYESEQNPILSLQKLQTRSKLTSAVFQFVQPSEYAAAVKPKDGDLPKLVAKFCLDGTEMIKDACIPMFGRIITNIKSLQEGLCLLVMSYLVLDLDLPQKFSKMLQILFCFCFGFEPLGVGLSQAHKKILVKLFEAANTSSL